jgi:Uma2 family endonuclease
LFWFYQHEKEWNIRAIQEQRTRLTPTRYRIPDVCVFRRDLPREQIFIHRQLVAIEVLSPEDRQTRLQERIDDFINSECRISGRLILPGESDGTARTELD